MTEFRDRIAQYYPAIDRVDTEWVLSLFIDEAIYKRADREYRSILKAYLALGHAYVER